MKSLLNINGIGIKKRLYILIIVLIIIPVVVTGTYMEVSSIYHFANQERSTALGALMQSKTHINYVLSEVDNISLMLLYNDSVQSLYRALILKNDQSKVDVLQRNVSQSVSTLVFNRPYINAVMISNENKKLFEYGEAVTQEDPELYAKAVEKLGKPIWTCARQIPYTVRVNSQYYISLYRAVSDLNQYGKVIGVCRISFEESIISDSLKQLNTYKGSECTVYNSIGEIVTSTNAQMLGRSGVADSILEQIKHTDKEFGYFSNRSDGKTYLFYRIGNPEWIVVQTVDNQHFYSGAVSSISLVSCAIVLCVLFTIVYSRSLSRTIIRPIHRMHDAMEQVQGGNLDITIEETNLDELGQLSREFVYMAHELKNLIQTKYEQQLLLKEAELRNLQSQINPHFLYNTLDTIRWISVKNDDQEVCEQIEALSDLFRHVLNNGEEMTTVGHELLHLENYLVLQKARYGNKISIVTDIDETLLGVSMPKLLIQPLVENAIYHGIENKVGQGTVKLTIRREDQSLVIIVEDDGVGIDEKAIIDQLHSERRSNFSALKNINDRIQLRYGNEYGEFFQSCPGKGTKVEIRLPMDPVQKG